MELKSTRLKAEQIIREINMLDHTQMPIDKFLALEQLIAELRQNNIDFEKLPKYGCPSEFISCVFACKGIKPNATPTMCANCWKEALTENIYVDASALPSPEPEKPPINPFVTALLSEGRVEEAARAIEMIKEKELAQKQAEEENIDYDSYDEDIEFDADDYTGALGISPNSGANYFATAAESIKEQFSKQSKPKKKPFFKKPKKEQTTNPKSETKHVAEPPKTIEVPSEYDVLKQLNLTPEQILKIFDILEWSTIEDFDLLCDVLKSMY